MLKLSSFVRGLSVFCSSVMSVLERYWVIERDE